MGSTLGCVRTSGVTARPRPTPTALAAQRFTSTCAPRGHAVGRCVSSAARPGSLRSHRRDKGQGGPAPARPPAGGYPSIAGREKDIVDSAFCASLVLGTCSKAAGAQEPGARASLGRMKGERAKPLRGGAGRGVGGDAASADGLQPRDSCREPHEESAWGLCPRRSSGLARGFELYHQELQESL